MNAWITFINSNDYFWGALGLYHSLQKVKSKYGLIIMIIKDTVSDENINYLRENNISYDLIDDYSFINSDVNYLSHKSTLNKFQMYKYFDKFDKLCFVDADVVFLKNIDYIFYFDYFFTKGYTGLISGGIFLLNKKDNKLTFEEIYNKHKFQDNDEQILNHYYLGELFKGPDFDYTFNERLSHHAGIPKYWNAFNVKNFDKIKKFIYISERETFHRIDDEKFVKQIIAKVGD